MDHDIRHLVDFIDASPTAFHAIENLAAKLDAAGATRLPEEEPWALEPGALYYTVRHGSSLVAFRMGLLDPASHGFLLAGGHTDSPALQIRLEKQVHSRGFDRVAVEMYGAPILSGWLDRPLGIAGMLALREGEKVKTLLYRSHEAAAIIPNLAIHLNRDINKGFEYSLHQHLPAIIGIETLPAGFHRYPPLLTRISEELGIKPESVIAAHLNLFEQTPSCTIGNDLLNAPRLDDLAACAAIIEALLSAQATAATQVACFLDAEEIGSMTVNGAQSVYLRDILARIMLAGRNSGQDFYRALAKSFCVSVDAAQGFHPGYPEKFDDYYTPLLGKGIAIKSNANMNYATDAATALRARLIADAARVSLQHYKAKADIQPGKTIGPITASRTGIPAVDIGHPMLAMHAIRETIALADHTAMIAFLRSFYSGA
ncbi:MAG: M18 family aminopeptidase [Spirochaetaceae bacterium]|nr:M18 family aminopeptidase [Spirochaetaceae bacterium]